MKHITFIQILKPASNAVQKLQTSEGELEGRQLMEMLSDEGTGDAPFIY